MVALIPTGLSGYSFLDASTGKRVKLNKKNEGLISEEAICFYKPLPLKKLGMPDLARYIIEALSIADLVLIALATLSVTLVGMLGPKLNNLLFSTVVESGSMRLLGTVAAFFVAVSLSTLLLSAVKSLLMARINTKLSLSMQAGPSGHHYRPPVGGRAEKEPWGHHQFNPGFGWPGIPVLRRAAGHFKRPEGDEQARKDGGEKRQ